MTIYEAIRSARKKAGLSQAKLSKLSGVNVATISKIEYDHHVPRIETCVKLADALGISVDELIGKKHYPFDEIKTPKEWRKEFGVPVRTIVEKSGVSDFTIRVGIEGKKHDVLIANVEACADALGLGIDEYIGHEVKT